MIGIIPAAGKGVRFKELGKQYAKTILPFGEKPILIHQIEWLERHGCNDIRVVLNHQQHTVKDVLKFYDKKIKIYEQKEQNGLSSAILSTLNENDKDDNVIILLGDLIVTQDISKEKFKENFISVKEVPDYSRWCMVEKINHSLTFIDKPSKKPNTNLSVSGVYHILSSSLLFQLLKKQIKDNERIHNEFQISTILQKISNKQGMNILFIEMIDFGTLEEYLQNRQIKTSRSFNNIKEKNGLIYKESSLKREKIINEYNWYFNLPPCIQLYTPRIFKKNFFGAETSYVMEKVLAPSLRELYLFIDTSNETWENIFDSIFNLLNEMKQYGHENLFMNKMVEKTKQRVLDIDIPIENKLVNKFLKYFETNVNNFSKPALLHGDFCWSNLLYDFTSSKIIMIDPRGELFGDHYYDIAKVFHSILYDYDFVDTELYIMKDGMYKLYNNGKINLKKLFLSKIKKLYTKEEINHIKMITASLFLSMIPLHYHNKNNQYIYYNIFKEIYKQLEK